jgi:hypothetical protein
MKTPSLKLAIAATVAGTAFAITAPSALAQDAATFKSNQQVAFDKALQQGPEAVRRYIFRTRMIYALTWADFYGAE